MFSRLSLLCVLLMATIPATAQVPPVESGVSQSLAKWRAAHYSDVRYRLDITLEKQAPLMRGEIEIRVNLTEEGAKNDLILDWRTTQFANDKDNPFANVISVNDAERTGAQASPLANVAESGVKMLDSDEVSSQRTSFSRSPLIASGTLALQSLALQSNEHLIIPSKFLKTGENVIKIEFASPIKTSGAAVTRYVDKEDGAEYVYSLFVPSDTSTAFPVFDQPDLKARFQLTVICPDDWKVVSNTNADWNILVEEPISDTELKLTGKRDFEFEETKPISTYVFAFAAGEFAEVSEPSAVADGLTRKTENSNKNPNASNAKLKPPATADGSDLSTKIYVRKSQAEKFKQHAAEVFRLNREGVKFLESWFDYKFPFSKYDLVLIPEFPFGGMEHAGATFLREDRIVFPTEPTKNDYITRANLIFHEAAHQWFGDTVTMKWFDDLWLKEGFAEFMAYKTLEKVLPEYNAWKVFYERNKQAAYLTDVTRGTTPIYQEIPNLSSAKSAYGNIVYRKAPSFLKQTEFYLGEKEFQTAVRAFLKKHEFANAEWTDLVKEFETASGQNLNSWAKVWVQQRGMPVFNMKIEDPTKFGELTGFPAKIKLRFSQSDVLHSDTIWSQKLQFLYIYENGKKRTETITLGKNDKEIEELWGINFLGREAKESRENLKPPKFIFTNYQDYGYGIFLLDEKSRAYVLENIQNEKDDFLRSMMWGSLWDSLRFYELAPEAYVKLAIKNIKVEQDESTIQLLLNRVSTAMTYYLSEPPAVAGGLTRNSKTSQINSNASNANLQPSAAADGSDLRAQIENLLIERMRNAPTAGLRITYYRAFVANATSENARTILKELLRSAGSLAGVSESKAVPPQASVAGKLPALQLRTKDKFDIVTKLITLGDADGLTFLAELEKTETDDAAKRYAYAARAGIPTKENKARYWRDFTENKEIPESWIESAFAVWNTPRHSEMTLPYLEKALLELPNLKRNRKIFFVNGWLSAFIGGQKNSEALTIINKFLEENPDLDNDLRLKILENSDGLERAVKSRDKFRN